jgi:hypothetical protein
LCATPFPEPWLSIRILASLLVSQSHGSARCLWQGSSPGFALHTIELSAVNEQALRKLDPPS